MIKRWTFYCIAFVLQGAVILSGCPAEEEENARGADQRGKNLGPCLEDNKCNDDLYCVDKVCRPHPHQEYPAEPLPPRRFEPYDGGLPAFLRTDSGSPSSEIGDAGQPHENTPNPVITDSGILTAEDAGSWGSCNPTLSECDDGDPCNGIETCHEGLRQCISGSPIQCDDGNPCNGIETCNSGSGQCEDGVPIQCPQEHPGGFYACHPDTGTCLRTGSCLRQEPIFTGYDVGHPCDDGNPCNGQESCDPATGLCQKGQPVVCDDQNPCNGEEICNIFSGVCEAGIEMICDDGNPCNGNEICDPQNGNCVQGPTPQCNDANPCNGEEICDVSTGTCLAGAPVQCYDSDPCNGEESCNPDTGLCDAAPPLACGDGNACNGNEVCDRSTGSCANGNAPSCDDGNACTIDQCDTATGGCSHEALPCADGNACTSDSCSNGQCVHQNNTGSESCAFDGGGGP